MNSTFYYLHALSPLHVGIEQGAGVIDMPIAREKTTGLPLVPGSGLKGVLRYELKDDLAEDWEILFGPERVADTESGFAGALTLGDAHLLCLPVRALVGTFAWATCPFILARYVREAKVFFNAPVTKLPPLSDTQALTTTETKLVHDKKVVLEDLDLDHQNGADEWAQHIAEIVFNDDPEWQTLFKQRFVILPDGVLDFLAETATEVRARIKISEETRVVQKGALWYEENLPIETVLYGIVAAERSRKEKHALNAEDILKKLPKGPRRLQLGGNASTGHGLVNWIKGGK